MRQGKGLNIAIAALWARQRDEMLRRVDVVDAAIAALLDGKLPPAQRAEAERAAQRIANTARSFGFAEASEHARQIQLDLRRGSISLAKARRLAELVLEIRRDFEREPDLEDEAEARPHRFARPRADVLLVGGERLPVHELQTDLAARGLRVAVARASDDIASRLKAEIAIVDLSDPLASQFMGGLKPGRHEVVIGVAAEAGLESRAAFARRGGRILLSADLAPHEIGEAVMSMRERLREENTHVLVVDDDPALLEVTSRFLRAHDLEVTTLDDPRRFWHTLATRNPDVLLLDLEMPGVNGLGLCRALRADARWSQLPVLFLTERRDAEAVRAIFAAGADDYLQKPVVEEELVQRIRNRLARARLLRDLADCDPLTGVANRRKASEQLARLERIAKRYGQPLTLAILDVVQFKQVNNSFGHDVGDEVLRRLVRRLQSEFRGEDVVGRWNTWEFVIGMYGMPAPMAVDRLRGLLENWKRERFDDRRGGKFAASFTVGLAELPTSADSLEELHRAAAEALLRAKDAGGGRVEAHRLVT
jgi:diguanylate cyclase (GGDEF)-like protein